VLHPLLLTGPGRSLLTQERARGSSAISWLGRLAGAVLSRDPTRVNIKLALHSIFTCGSFLRGRKCHLKPSVGDRRSRKPLISPGSHFSRCQPRMRLKAHHLVEATSTEVPLPCKVNDAIARLRLCSPGRPYKVVSAGMYLVLLYSPAPSCGHMRLPQVIKIRIFHYIHHRKSLRSPAPTFPRFSSELLL
jgi:hypothetical protein